MKKFQIKYQTYDGQVRTITKTGYDEQHVINQLINCKEVYWCRKEQEENVVSGYIKVHPYMLTDIWEMEKEMIAKDVLNSIEKRSNYINKVSDSTNSLMHVRV
jgi:hypothetical protein